MTSITLKPLSEQVIVITGASSGIGLLTARRAAVAGAKVVLAARDEQALQLEVTDLSEQGHRALAVGADVGREADVEKIAREAVDAFGRIDTWVNNAGVDIWGELMDVSTEDSRRLFDTNFWGQVYGSRIAVPYLKRQGGALINVGSVAGDRAFPLQGMYCATKHAVKAFTDALRMELEAANAGISVTLIKPSSIATPLSQQAKNYLGREPRLPSPLYSVEDVADAILYAAQNQKRDIYVGSSGAVLATLANIFPNLGDTVGETLLTPAQLRDVPAAQRRDNLHSSGPFARRTSIEDPEGRSVRRSISTAAILHPALATLALSSLGIALALSRTRRRY
jgi:NAD(P)-dependent dehydrogenase (short-subunit alcohol dehydrogenase family)